MNIVKRSIVVRSGLTAVGGCTDCSGGMACDETGLVAPIRPCAAAYFCEIRSQSTTPDQAPDAAICPAGSYCAEESHAPTPCPSGTYSPDTGRSLITECLACTAGSYCDQTG